MTENMISQFTQFLLLYFRKPYGKRLQKWISFPYKKYKIHTTWIQNNKTFTAFDSKDKLSVYVSLLTRSFIIFWKLIICWPINWCHNWWMRINVICHCQGQCVFCSSISYQCFLSITDRCQSYISNCFKNKRSPSYSGLFNSSCLISVLCYQN